MTHTHSETLINTAYTQRAHCFHSHVMHCSISDKVTSAHQTLKWRNKPKKKYFYINIKINRYEKYSKLSLIQSLLVSSRGHIPTGFFLFWDDRIPTLWDLPDSSCSFPLSQRSLGNVLKTNSVCPQWPQRSFLKTPTFEMSVSCRVTHRWLATNIK